MQYDNERLSHYSRKILEINSKIKYNLGPLSCQSGSPLINKYNNNLIFGINTLKKEKLDNTTFNLATPFDVILKNIKWQIFYNRKTINLIYEKNIKDEHLINIFGQKFVENNKDNILLKINGVENKLTEKYNLKEGINNVQKILINNLVNLESMFFNVISLKNIKELKYLNTKEVSNFSEMFVGCASLSEVKALENWNV